MADSCGLRVFYNSQIKQNSSLALDEVIASESSSSSYPGRLNDSTRRPTNWWSSAKRDVTHTTATLVYNTCYHLLSPRGIVDKDRFVCRVFSLVIKQMQWQCDKLATLCSQYVIVVFYRVRHPSVVIIVTRYSRIFRSVEEPTISKATLIRSKLLASAFDVVHY